MAGAKASTLAEAETAAGTPGWDQGQILGWGWGSGQDLKRVDGQGLNQKPRARQRHGVLEEPGKEEA